MTRATGKGRGGRRPGAGGKLKNKSALKSGFYSKDPSFLVWWHSLTPDQQDYARNMLKKSGWEPPETVENDQTVVSLDSHRGSRARTSPQYIHTQRQTIKRSNGEGMPGHRATALARTLLDYGMHNATNFVEKHIDALDEIERVIREFQDMERHNPEQVIGIVAKGPYLRQQIHETLAIRTGRLVQCPYCGTYKQFLLVAPPEREVEGL